MVPIHDENDLIFGCQGSDGDRFRAAGSIFGLRHPTVQAPQMTDSEDLANSGLVVSVSKSSGFIQDYIARVGIVVDRQDLGDP